MPPPTPAVGQVMLFSVESSHSPSSQIGLNGCHFRVSAVTGGGLDVQQLAVQFLANIQADWPAVNDSTVTLDCVKSFLLDSTTGKVLQSGIALDNATVGTHVAGIAPSQVAPVVNKGTGLAGRKYRGRCYFPFMTVAYLTSTGELTAAGQVALQAYYAGFISTQVLAAGGSSTTLVPVLKGAALPLAPTDIVSRLVTGKLGTQRRRGDYGRVNSPS
jgi:hypothetical protein